MENTSTDSADTATLRPCSEVLLDEMPQGDPRRAYIEEIGRPNASSCPVSDAARRRVRATAAKRSPAPAPERGAFDLLVTDVVMPHMNGRELTDALAAAGIHLPVLYMSGYTEDQVVRRGVASAREHMLDKPFRLTDLVARVRAVLDAS